MKRSFAKNTYLYHPGNPGLNLYLIETGRVRLFFANTRGDEFLINLYGPHTTVGLPLLMEDQVRLVGASAHQDSVAWVFARDDVFRLMKSSQRLMFNIYLELSDALRRLALYAEAQVLLNLDGRLANLFLYLTRNGHQEEVNEIEIALNQSEVASWVGASRGRINRAMGKMQERGLIRVNGQKIYILDRRGLAQMALDLRPDKV